MIAYCAVVLVLYSTFHDSILCGFVGIVQYLS